MADVKAKANGVLTLRRTIHMGADTTTVPLGLAVDLAQEVLRLYDELKDLQKDVVMREAYAFDMGVDSVFNSMPYVYTDPEAEPEEEGFIDGDKPFCRIRYYYDAGDKDVGIDPIGFWMLHENQDDTILGEKKDGSKNEDSVLPDSSDG